MIEIFNRAACALLVVALATATAACSAKSASAASQGPNRATVVGLIKKYHGGENSQRRFQFHGIRTAKPHVLRIAEVYGLRGGTKVWPTVVNYTVFTSGFGSIDAPGSTCDRDDIAQFFYFYKNEFGDWADYAASSSENSEKQSHPYSPCTNMPGSAIFRTAP
jgi:hypothetical protein